VVVVYNRICSFWVNRDLKNKVPFPRRENENESDFLIEQEIKL
jgi:hypothetical protein